MRRSSCIDQSPSMALKPKLRPAPRGDHVSGRVARAFQGDAQGFDLGAQGLILDRLLGRCPDAAQNFDGAIEVQQDRILHAGRFTHHHLGETALREERAHAFEIARGICECQTAPPERGELRSRLVDACAKRLAELLIADQLYAGGERLEDIERDLLSV